QFLLGGLPCLIFIVAITFNCAKNNRDKIKTVSKKESRRESKTTEETAESKTIENLTVSSEAQAIHQHESKAVANLFADETTVATMVADKSRAKSCRAAKKQKSASERAVKKEENSAKSRRLSERSERTHAKEKTNPKSVTSSPTRTLTGSVKSERKTSKMLRVGQRGTFHPSAAQSTSNSVHEEINFTHDGSHSITQTSSLYCNKG
ncbi:hypothetical protein PFISCL1PPCAC_3763, partial [Pristionchus fissidentatus]